MLIRELRRDEIPELINLYDHYISKENLPDVSLQKREKIWDQIKANPLIKYFVLEVDGKIIASCILSITPSFIRGGDGFGVIEHVVTHRDYRRRGYGKSIVDYSLKYAWDKGCTEVLLLSGSQNENAHKMYEKIGFDKNRKKGFVMYRPKSE